MGTSVEFLELFLISVFVFVPILRFHAMYVLFKARRFMKHHSWKESGVQVTGIGVITDRLIVATTGAVASTILAIIGMNRLMGFPLWEQTGPVGFAMLVIALLLFAVPAVVWEYFYITGKLEE